MKQLILLTLCLSMAIFSCKKKKFERKIDNGAWVCVEHELTRLGQNNFEKNNQVFRELYLDFEKDSVVRIVCRIDSLYDTSNYLCFVNQSLYDGELTVGVRQRNNVLYKFDPDLPNVFKLDSNLLEIREMTDEDLILRTYGDSSIVEYYKFSKINEKDVP